MQESHACVISWVPSFLAGKPSFHLSGFSKGLLYVISRVLVAFNWRNRKNCIYSIFPKMEVVYVTQQKSPLAALLVS